MKLFRIFSLVLLCGIGFQLSNDGVLQAERTKATFHRVRRGDTLGGIARKYRTTVKQLRNWNRLGPRTALTAGRMLRVGSAGSRRGGRTARPEKTIPVGNRWVPTSHETKVLTPISYTIPEPYEKLFRGEEYELRIFAEKFAQGNAAYVELRSPRRGGFGSGVKVSVVFDRETIPLTPTAYGLRGLFAIGPEKDPGTYRLTVDYDGGPQRQVKRHFSIAVSDTSYPVFTRRVYLGQAEKFKPMEPEIAELISRSAIKRKQAFATRSADKLSARLSHPRDLHRVTSPFYTTRKIVQFYREAGRTIYKPTSVRPHAGLDLRGRWGDPILAMADGRVVCAQRMHYEGNFTIIDHGNQVFTGYMHQSKFSVREGDYVRAGQKIGEAGNTGASTGPHLHIALWIRGEAVHPLSLLALPIR